MALCVYVGVCGVFFNEVAARAYVFAHQHGEDAVGFGGIADVYLFQHAVFGMHGGVAEFGGAHLAQTFEPLDFHFFAVVGDEALKLVVVPAVFFGLAYDAFV